MTYATTENITQDISSSYGDKPLATFLRDVSLTVSQQDGPVKPHQGQTPNQPPIINLRERGALLEPAAAWFHAKWGVPLEAYRDSMAQCLKQKNAVPQWYLAMDGDRILGGLGVIENDFHNRKDLAPNVCAVYVEEDCRRQGIAGRLLNHVCGDMARMGVDTLYLLTGHTSFYERYGWEFLCMAQGDGEPELSRVYIHKSQ